MRARGEKLAITAPDAEPWIQKFSGFPRVQLIDLDAAMGRGDNAGIVSTICGRLPCRVGGGIRNLEDMRDVLLAGAEKVSVNSLAVKNPDIIRQGARAFGNQCIVLGMDARKSSDPKYPSGYEIVIQGGRTPVQLDAVEWARKAESLGAGEICLNSIDADGTKEGYELELTRKVSEAVGIPVIASGGAGIPQHLVDVLREGKADAALVASMVHYGTYTVGGIKEEMARAGLPVRR